MKIQLDRNSLIYRGENDRQVVIVLGSQGELEGYAPGRDGGALYVTADNGSLVEWRVRSVDRDPNYVAYMVLNPADHDHGATVMIKGGLLTFMGDEYECDADFRGGASIEVTPFAG